MSTELLVETTKARPPQKQVHKKWVILASTFALGILLFLVGSHFYPQSSSAVPTISSSLGLSTKAPEPKPTFYISSSTSTRPSDYKCTGENDDDVINEAILNLGGEGILEIQLSEGVFNISRQIIMRSNLRIRGYGIDKTVLRQSDSPQPLPKAGFIRGKDIENITLSGFTADGNREAIEGYDAAGLYGRYGFFCEVCKNMLLSRVRITGHYGYGFDPHGLGGEYIYSEKLRIYNCVADNNGWDGITIDKTIDTIISNTLVENNGRHGINVVTGSIDTVIKSNTIRNNGFFYYTGSRGNGIMIQNNQDFGTKQTRVQGNTITNSRGRGLVVNDSVDDIIKLNVIDQPNDTGSCARFRNTTRAFVSDNDCMNRVIEVQGENPGLKIYQDNVRYTDL